MKVLISAAVGVAIGAIHSSLALGPVARTPMEFTVKGVVVRFIARLFAVAVVLAAALKAGADAAALLLAVAAGFTLHTGRILRRPTP